MTKDKPKESGTIFILQRSTDSNSEIHVSEDDIDDASWEYADDVTKPLLQKGETDRTNINKTAQSSDDVQETVGTTVNVSEIPEETLSVESGIHNNTSIQSSETATDPTKEWTDIKHESLTVKNALDSVVIATENVKEDIQPQRKPKKVRKVCSVPKTFKISLDKKKWRAIKPTIG